MAEFESSRPPDGSFPFDPIEGMGPHLSERFFSQYGKHSVFVLATSECLTLGVLRVLDRAGCLHEDKQELLNNSEVREPLEYLLQALEARGLDRPGRVLWRAALGQEAPEWFLDAAGSLLGEVVVSKWLSLFEKKDYAGAKSMLVEH